MGQGVGELNVAVTARTGKARADLASLASTIRTLPRSAAGANSQVATMNQGLSALGMSSGSAAAGLAKAGAAAAIAGLAYMGLKKGLQASLRGMERLDALGKSADKLGADPAKLAGLRLAAEEAGVDVGQLDSSLAKMTKRVGDAGLGSKDAASALKRLGLDATSLGLEDPVTQFRAISERLREIKPTADQARIAYALFGRSGTDLLNVLRMDAAGFNEAQQAAENLGLAMGRDQIAAAERASDAWGRISKAGEGLGNTLAVLVAPAVENAGRFLSDMLSEVTGGLQHLGAMDQYNDAAAEAERITKRAAEAEAERVIARQKLNDSYRDELKLLREKLAETQDPEQAQFDKDTKKYGLIRAMQLGDARDRIALAEEEKAQNEKLLDLKRQIAEFGKKGADKQGADLVAHGVTQKIKDDAARLGSQLARLEKEKQADDKRRAIAKREREAIKDLQAQVAVIGKTGVEADRIKGLAGITDSGRRSEANALFDKLAREEERKKSFELLAESDRIRKSRKSEQNSGPLDALSKEGYAALRANVHDSIPAQTLAVAQQQLDATREMAKGIEDLTARSFFEEVFSLN